MIIALFTNIMKAQAHELAIGIRQFLVSRGVHVVAEEENAQELEVDSLSSVDPNTVDFIISLGGDGTILRIFHAYPELDAPVLGINLGGLGFMTDITVDTVYSSLQSLLDGQYQTQYRLMMQGESSTQKQCCAINEIVIHRAHYPYLIDLAIYVDGQYLNTFAADGVIIATPNGSTAYSLAAGGPILTPDLQAYVITPISPHTISNRPIVLLPKRELQVRYLNEGDAAEVTYDGCGRFPLYAGETLHITIPERKFQLITMMHYDYFATLRTKLGWTGRLKK
jgi:NAD+ kinase